MPPEFVFLSTGSGTITILGIAVAAVALTLRWMTRPGQPERHSVVASAVASLVILTGITILAVKMGWWQGSFTELPLLTLAGLYVFLSFPGFSLWIGIYRWLKSRFPRAVWIFAAVCLAFIPVVLLVDPWQMKRGQFSMGGGYTILADALLGQVVLWAPILLYELFLKARDRRLGTA